jgi:hypothetical protein
MLSLLQQLLRLAAFVFVGFIGLFMALVFIGSTVVAIAILTVLARLRGKNFSAKEYWQTRRTRRKPLAKSGSFSTKDTTNVTDVKARDV